MYEVGSESCVDVLKVAYDMHECLFLYFFLV